jgi:serine/threonine protein kinase
MDYKKKYLKYKKKYFKLKYGGMQGAFGNASIKDCKEYKLEDKCEKLIVKTAKNNSGKKQLKNECSILTKLKELKNKYIISLYKCDEEKLLIEYSSIGSLRSNIKELKQNDKISIINGLIEGLIFLHENNIIHRDIKPENIVLFRKNNILYPKYIDFGISNTKRIFNGTRRYMNNYPKNIDLYKCKDIIDNSKQPDKKEECYKKYDSKVMNRLPILRDYYALGCVIFEIIYGKKYQSRKNSKLDRPEFIINSNGNKLLDFIMNLLNNDEFILTEINFEEKDLPSSTNNIITNTPAKTLTRTAIFSPTKLLSPGIKRNIKSVSIIPKKLKME